MTSVARLIALPIVSGQEATGPGYSYSPQTHAKPAQSQQPGRHAHHGPQHITHLMQR